MNAPKPLSSPDYPKTLKTLGDHIRKKRLDLGLLQKDAARIIYTNPDTIWNWENDYSTPSLFYIPKIIKFLGYVPFDTSNQTLCNKIIIYRKLLGISQRKIARPIGIDPSTLGHWESGKTKPNPDKLAKLLTNI